MSAPGLTLAVTRRVVLLVATFGFVLVPAMVLASGGPLFAGFLSSFYWPQLGIAALGLYGVAWLGAPKLAEGGPHLGFDSIALAVKAFAAGAVAGCLANYFVLGRDFRRRDFESLVLTPLFWMALFGLPLAILVGLLLGSTLKQRVRRSRNARPSPIEGPSGSDRIL